VLSAPGAGTTGENDGLLTASEIARLSLNADWVILSACNTASGETRGAASFGGLASAFIHAGARALLVSHWPVRDDAAAFLSTRTLALNASGLSHAEALRRAMLELMGKRMGQNMGRNDPSIWAPFVVIEP
jgi:CHAT domain-containing protein